MINGDHFDKIPESYGDRVKINGESYVATNVSLSGASWSKNELMSATDYANMKAQGSYTPEMIREYPGNAFADAKDSLQLSYTPTGDVRSALNEWTANANDKPLSDIISSGKADSLIQNNQDYLTSKSGNTVSLYRGMQTGTDYVPSNRGFESWTSDPEVARSFSDEGGAILQSDVPTSSILFSPNQGFGSWGESEFIVSTK